MILLIHYHSRYKTVAFRNLNSIMILLIRKPDLCTVYKLQHLNSIMILLILVTRTVFKLWEELFKFHYDSINSYSQHRQKNY